MTEEKAPRDWVKDQSQAVLTQTAEDSHPSFISQFTIATEVFGASDSGKTSDGSKMVEIEEKNGFKPNFSFMCDLEEAKLKIQRFEEEVRKDILSSLTPVQLQNICLPEKVSIYSNEIFSHLIESQVPFKKPKYLRF
jgi:hypothetical protein